MVREQDSHTSLVYTENVKNITFSADQRQIELARERARQQNTTLAAAFREWLEEYSGELGRERVKAFRDVMKRLSYVRPGRKFTREEANARD